MMEHQSTPALFYLFSYLDKTFIQVRIHLYDPLFATLPMAQSRRARLKSGLLLTISL